MDGTDNQPTSTDDDPTRAASAGAQPGGESGGGSSNDGPLKFDFKLRLGSREETSAQLQGRATGELVQLQPIDWESLAGAADEPRSYQSEGDLPSIIVQLANQIAGPETTSTPNVAAPVISLSGSATIDRLTTARATPGRRPAPTSVAEPVAAEPVAAAAPVAVEQAEPVIAAASVAVEQVEALQFSPIAPLPPTAVVVEAADAADAAVVEVVADATATPVATATPAAEPDDAHDAGSEVVAARPDAPVGVEVVASAEVAAPVEVAASVEVADGPAAAPAPISQHADPVASGASAAPDPSAADVRSESPEVVVSEVVDVVQAVIADAAAQAALAVAAEPVASPAPAVVEPVVAAAPTLAPRPAAEDAAQPPAASVAAPAPVAPAVPAMLTGEASVQAVAVAAAPPTSPPPALSLAKIERRPGAERPTKPVDFHALLGQAGFQAQPAKRRKKRHPFRALFKLVVVLGVIGGGLYFGKVQVLDKRWEPGLKPAAEAVAAERDLGWKRAVKHEVLAADEYASKLATHGLGIDEETFEDTLAEWRAMGLAEGRVDLETIGAASMASAPVFYDPVDERIYELDDVGEGWREVALHVALGEALLDQHVGWSDIVTDPEIDRGEAQGIRMMVFADASSLARTILDPDVDDLVEWDEELREIEEAAADEILAAPAYAVARIASDPGASVLFDLAGSDVDQRAELLEVRSDATVLDAARDRGFQPDEIATAVADTRGMLYWYHVLASRLPSSEAWDAALAWEGDEVVVDNDTGNGSCVTAKVSTVDEPGRLRLLDALTRWAAGAPAEAGTAVAAIGTEWIEVSSCDPGAAADTVTNASIDAVGEAPVEHAVLFRADAETDEQRACVVNAVRAFDVAAVFARGDGAEIDSVVASIATACENPA